MISILWKNVSADFFALRQNRQPSAQLPNFLSSFSRLEKTTSTCNVISYNSILYMSSDSFFDTFVSHFSRLQIFFLYSFFWGEHKPLRLNSMFSKSQKILSKMLKSLNVFIGSMESTIENKKNN